MHFDAFDMNQLYSFRHANKGDILLDYRTKKGIAEGINHYYETKDIGMGAVKFYFTRENAFVYQTDNPQTDRYRWQVRHDWDLGEGTDTKAVLEFNTMSDRNFIRDYIYNEYEELGATPDSYLAFMTQKQGYSTEFLVRKRFDKFLDVVERLPEFSITVPDNNIFPNTPIYYRSNASAVVLNHTFDNTNTASPQKDLNTGRIDMYNRLSYALKLFRALNVTPYAAVEDTYYSTLMTSRNRVRNIFSAGVDNSIKFYKAYDVETDFLGLDIHKLRHVLTPTVNYFYTHEPSIAPNKLNQFDAMDAINKTNGVTLGLENRLQTKRPDSQGNLKSVDLATLLVSTTYTCTFERGSLETKDDQFKSIDFDLELIPYSWAYLKATMSVDPKHYWVQNQSIDLVATGGDKWSLDISNRYEHVVSNDSSLVSVDGSYRLTEKWKVRAYGRYSTLKGAFEEQEYTITRDLHCWIGELTFRFDDTGSAGLWLIFKLKAFPQTPIGLRQTYSHPRFGEAGAH